MKIPKYSIKEVIGLILGPLSFIIVYNFISPEGLSAEARSVLAGTLWIAIWWILEPLPLPVTSMLPVIIFPLTGAISSRTTTAAYGDPMIFLFLGGFIIATAMEKYNLHKRIALKIILAVGTDPKKIILGFMLATAFLSLWISNTATTMMMMPISLAVVLQLSTFIKQKSGDENNNFGKAMMICIAYASSIGGMGTLVGTPTNAIFAAVVKQLYHAEISFADWMIFAMPFVILMIFIGWYYLVRFAFPLHNIIAPHLGIQIEKEHAELGKVSQEEKWVLAVFGFIAFAWITRSFLLNLWLPELDDTMIAVFGAIALFIIPSASKPGKSILDWNTAVKLPWGILLLFGGGLAIAVGFKDSGLAAWIGNQLTLLEGISIFLLIVVVIAMVNFLTEVTSNVATATMILPVLASLAVAVNVHPFALMAGATIASSCAFMLPVATPGNAIVFGSGYLQIKDMIKAGFWMNIISIVLMALLIYFYLPLVWSVDLNTFPIEFNK